MCKEPNCIRSTCCHPTCVHAKLFGDYGVFKACRLVNINGCDTKGVAIIDMCDKCLPYLWHKLNELYELHLHIRIKKKFVEKYAEEFNRRGWVIDPRRWSSDDPLRFCWYASVERQHFYIAPSTYE